MSNWRLNTNQWLVTGAAVIIGGLSLLAGMYVAGSAIILAGGVLVWYLGPRGKRPENIPVLSWLQPCVDSGPSYETCITPAAHSGGTA